ncbi:MAG: glycosyltransferase [Anaerolineae bacterium]|nr:glycosyltransferase [Anaerolineae bacterium]
MPETVSVIIPAYNSATTLGACLTALQRQTQPPLEIIVVDDGSTDGTGRVARAYGVIVLSQSNRGAGVARNRGALAARGHILLFTDADCEPTSDWIEQMLIPFCNEAVVGVKGRYRTRQPQWVARFIQQEYQDRYDLMADQAQIDFIDTYSAGYRREVFWANAGFDPSFRIVEDQEFSFRLAERGYMLVYQPKAVVYHHHKASLAGYAHRKFLVGYWKPAIIRRYPAKLKRDSHTPPSLKIQAALSGVGALLIGAGLLLRRRWLAYSGLGAELLVVLSGGSFLLKIGRRDPPVLLVAPLLLLTRAWALSLGFLLGLLKSSFYETH